MGMQKLYAPMLKKTIRPKSKNRDKHSKLIVSETKSPWPFTLFIKFSPLLYYDIL